MMASEELSFEVDAAIIARLGQELVAKQETALIELIKNSYDADATKVEVRFIAQGTERHLVIADDGTGMTRELLVNGFLRLASSVKAAEPLSIKYARRRAGKKGIGRFATERLGHRLVVTTATEDATTALMLVADWDRFSAGTALKDVVVTISDVEKSFTGTAIRIEYLRDDWTDAQLRQAWRGVLALQKPFPVAPVLDHPKFDPGFQVRIVRADTLFDDETVVSDIQREVLAHSQAAIELSVDAKGLTRWRISANRFGPDTDWITVDRTNEVPLRNVWMKAYYFVLDAELFPRLVYGRVREFLNEDGGVRLYKNGFRVVPYGDPDNDWLSLVAAYNKRSALAPIGNKNFFGVVEISDSSGPEFEEHTSREGLIRTPEFEALVSLLSSVLITAATRLAVDRGRKPTAGRAAKIPNGEAPLQDVRGALRSARQAAEAFLESGTIEAAERALEETIIAEEIVEERGREIAEATALLTDESAMLRFLATLGMTVAEFSHETGMSFDAFRLDLTAVFERASAHSNGETKFEEMLSRAREMVGRLDALTSYLNSLASARSARNRAPQSLRAAVEDFHAGIEQQAKTQGVDIKIDTPEFDPLTTVPMHSAEIASILLNLYTNAFKAMRRAGGSRRILVSATRTSENNLSLRFQDTGDGIPKANWERIFQAFFTTSNAPDGTAPDDHHARGTGLGLWIVAKLVEDVGGKVAVGSASPSYSTCIEVQIPGEPEIG